MSRKRLITLMALASLSALALGAPVSQADHPDDTMGKAECVLEPNSVAGSAVGGDGVNSILNDDLPFGNGGQESGMSLIDTDPGHFEFSGNAICSGVDMATEMSKPTPEVFAPFTALIQAAGDFDNLVCGTGTANGDARLSNPGFPGSGPDVQIYTEFGIKFVSGAGQLSLVVDADETPPGAASPPGGQIPTTPDDAESEPPMGPPPYAGHSFVGNNQIDGGMGAGVIDIVPTEPKDEPDKDPDIPCVNANTIEFAVNGAFYAFLSGEGSFISNTSTINARGDSDR